MTHDEDSGFCSKSCCSAHFGNALLQVKILYHVQPLRRLCSRIDLKFPPVSRIRKLLVYWDPQLTSLPSCTSGGSSATRETCNMHLQYQQVTPHHGLGNSRNGIFYDMEAFKTRFVESLQRISGIVHATCSYGSSSITGARINLLGPSIAEIF